MRLHELQNEIFYNLMKNEIAMMLQNSNDNNLNALKYQEITYNDIVRSHYDH